MVAMWPTIVVFTIAADAEPKSKRAVVPARKIAIRLSFESLLFIIF